MQTPEEFFWSIDYKLLKQQKKVLATILMQVVTKNSQREALEGVLSLLDHLEDTAEDNGFR